MVPLSLHVSTFQFGKGGLDGGEYPLQEETSRAHVDAWKLLFNMSKLSITHLWDEWFECKNI